MKTVIHTTHIDTGGHGYYSVSKKDFINVLSPEKITGCSGHNLTRIFLEEDCDASLFFDTCAAKGIEVKVNLSYNLKFNCTHNYVPELFNWQPKRGDVLNNGEYTIEAITDKHVIVIGKTGLKYKISLPSIFKYVTKVTAPESQPTSQQLEDLSMQCYDYIAKVSQKQGRLLDIKTLYGDGSRFQFNYKVFESVYNAMAEVMQPQI